MVVAQDNIRGRLAAGTVNGLTGNKTPPAPAGAIPADTYIGGAKKLDVGGRTALLTHVNNAHTDGDTWVYFADANVLATGDIFTNGRYPNLDFANGGDIRGLIRAADHDAIATLQPPNTAARPHIYIMNFLWCELLGATNVVDVVRVAAVNKNVLGLEMCEQVGDILIHSR